MSKFPFTRYWGSERFVKNFPAPEGTPTWLVRFDWLFGWSHGWANLEEPPNSVFCRSDRLAELNHILRASFGDHSLPNESFLVLGGEDTKLSSISLRELEQAQARFDHVYFEAVDTEVAGIDMMPIGLTEHYLRGYSQQLVRLLQRTRPSLKRSPRILGAWGKWWPHLDYEISDRTLARKFASTSPLVEVRALPTPDYFAALQDFAFTIVPQGNGVQTPKLLEALISGSIPVMTESVVANQWKSRGAPILVVPSWDAIDHSVLEKNHSLLSAEVDEFCVTIRDMDSFWTFSFPHLTKKLP